MADVTVQTSPQSGYRFSYLQRQHTQADRRHSPPGA